MHVLLIAFMAFGSVAPLAHFEKFEVTKVTLISEEEFNYLDGKEDSETEDIEEFSEEEAIEDISEILEIVAVANEPDIDAAPTIVIDEGAPKMIKRVAAIPVEASEPKIRPVDLSQDKRKVEPEKEQMNEDAKDAEISRESATTQTITEATETGDSLAPETSSLPQLRFKKDQTAKVQQKPKKTESSLIALAIGEKNAFRRELGLCWNFTALSKDAQKITIVVAFSLDEKARPLHQTIKMISANSGGVQAQRNAFEAARRAIIRCGSKGFSLPPEKYSQWKDMEVKFNPSLMRLR